MDLTSSSGAICLMPTKSLLSFDHCLQLQRYHNSFEHTSFVNHQVKDQEYYWIENNVEIKLYYGILINVRGCVPSHDHKFIQLMSYLIMFIFTLFTHVTFHSSVAQHHLFFM